MALNLKNDDVEELVLSLSALGETSQTECVRRALLDKRDQLDTMAARRAGIARFQEYLEREVWPKAPPGVIGGPRITEQEWEEMLGYGPDGV